MLATVCGYTIAGIDAMTMQDFLILSDYWGRYPPIHLMLRAYLGIGARQSRGLGDLLRLAGIDPQNGGRSSRLMH